MAAYYLQDIFNKYREHNENWEKIQQKFDINDIGKQVDQSKLRQDNINNLSEVELISYLKQNEWPTSFIPVCCGWMIGYYSLASYGMYKIAKPFTKKYVPRHRQSLGSIVKWGNLHFFSSN